MPFDTKAVRERDVVDQLAAVLEHMGFPPVAGRIVGRLMMCDPFEQSSADLADYVGASPGAISTTTRMLMQHGLVERVRIRADRKTYYKLREGAWNDLFHSEWVRLQRFRQIADQALTLMKDERPERRQRMQDFRDLNAFFEQEYPALLTRWDEQKRSET